MLAIAARRPANLQSRRLDAVLLRLLPRGSVLDNFCVILSGGKQRGSIFGDPRPLPAEIRRSRPFGQRHQALASRDAHLA